MNRNHLPHNNLESLRRDLWSHFSAQLQFQFCFSFSKSRKLWIVVSLRSDCE